MILRHSIWGSKWKDKNSYLYPNISTLEDLLPASWSKAFNMPDSFSIIRKEFKILFIRSYFGKFFYNVQGAIKIQDKENSF